MSPRMGEETALALALEGEIHAAQGETAKLVVLAGELAALPTPQIDPAFADALEARLLNEGLQAAPARPHLTIVRETPATDVDDTSRAPVVQFPRRRFVVRRSVAAVAAVASLAAFPVVAAAKSLPGSPFYGLKQWMHHVELAVFGTPVEDGFTLMNFASEHVDEAAQLAAFPHPNQSLIADTLAKATSELDQAKALIMGNTKDATILRKFAEKAQQTQNDMAAMAGSMPPGAARNALNNAIAATQRIQAAVAKALGFEIPTGLVMPGRGSASVSPVLGGTSQSGGSHSGSRPTSGGGQSDRSTVPGGTPKDVKDAAEQGCAVIGGDQVGDTLSPLTHYTCGMSVATGP